jgi:phosphatidylserine/phosphatidylglycerophosphate/cardiolipin synthase-like enzyme
LPTTTCLENPDDGHFLPALHPPPETNPGILSALPIEARAISGIPDLMHHKYIVADGKSVWTGSANWSVYSWSRQENVLVTIDSPEIASAYRQNFEELWSTGDVEKSDRSEPKRVRVGNATVTAWFTPGHGELAQHISLELVGEAHSHRLAGPDLADPGTLAELADDRRSRHRPGGRRNSVRPCSSSGATQPKWKVPLLEKVIESLPASAALGPVGTGRCATMHVKVTIVDDTVIRFVQPVPLR